jgi:murein DD-endopeptidase MepM/ murein hydrolase activator NlpD
VSLALAATVGLLLIAAVVTSGGAGSDGSQKGLRPGAVPANLAPVFVSAAATCDLPPALLAAQARQESGFRGDATSRTGAVGLMQFMPGTWASVGYDASGDGVADPRNAKDAIYSGARYDCQLRSELSAAGPASGDLDRLMLAAYNAGPAAVEPCRCVPAYAETQNYVTSILNLAASMQTTTGPARPAIAAAAGSLVYPLAARGAPTSPFGWRTSPTTGASELHAGQDLAAPAGTPVLAATAGTVDTAGWTDGYGNYVCVDRDPHFKTCYGHLEQIDVAVGQTLSAGQGIGLEGSTGNSTGPHLHFEVRLDGVPTNPLPYLPPGT